MNKLFLASFCLVFLLVIALGQTVPVQAHLNAMHVVSETNTTYTARSGTSWTSTTLGYNSNSYWVSSVTSSPGNHIMIWYCSESWGGNYKFHHYIAIPSNAGQIDGIFTYTAINTEPSENFSIAVNQENFGNEWAYLGWTLGKGGKPNCRVWADNYYSGATRQFWADAMKFYPSTSSTPPVQRHSFSVWNP